MARRVYRHGGLLGVSDISGDIHALLASEALGAGRISTAASRVAIHVIPTDEEAMVARHTRALVSPA